MKQGKLLHTFVGCNTPQGYVSFAEEDLRGLERIFMLLGAPGCGKSGVIARVAQSLRERGLQAELWQAAREAGAPEGVIIPELSAAVVDAGFWDYIRPQNPGVVEEVYNLADCWEADMLRRNHREIKQLNAVLKENMLAEARLLTVYQQEREKLYAAPGLRLTESELDEVCGALAKELFGAQSLRVRRFFATAYTAEGQVSYAQELSAACGRRYLLCGDAAAVLARVYEESVARGHSVDLYFDALAPERLQMLILPQLSVALVDAALPDLEPLYSDELLELSPAACEANAERADLTAAESDLLEVIRLSEENLHRLAAYYTAAVDFSKVDALCNDILAKLWQMAAERDR